MRGWPRGTAPQAAWLCRIPRMRGREITIEAEAQQAIWMDGEYHGNSPVTARVVPAALPVVAP